MNKITEKLHCIGAVGRENASLSRFKDVRAKISNIDFFSETLTIVRWRFSYVKNEKKIGGSPTSFEREHARKMTPNLKNIGLL